MSERKQLSAAEILAIYRARLDVETARHACDRVESNYNQIVSKVFAAHGITGPLDSYRVDDDGCIVLREAPETP